ncbi:MAG: SDR family oxidoreductase [Acidobacteria bacterium]|nr:MAG: SDR family oxidoreductase [Acidobacteriota bacterium]
MSDKKRVAIVTGASRGIGKAAIAALDARGVTAIGMSRNLPDDARNRRVDVADEASIRRAFEGVITDFGRIDILVNCAAVATTAEPLGLNADDWEAVLRPNLIGTYLCCKHAIPVMKQHGFGRVINVGSIAGRSFSKTGSIAYTASKYGVIGITRQLAAQFGRDGITVNCVAPSQTKTEMLQEIATPAQLEAIAAANPTGRLGEPRDVASAIVFLASDDASYINGAVLDINGGVL